MTKTGPALTPHLSGTGFGQNSSLPYLPVSPQSVVTNHAGLPRTLPVSELQVLSHQTPMVGSPHKEPETPCPPSPPSPS